MAATTLVLHNGSSSRAHQHPILLPPLLTNSSSSCCSSSSTFFSTSSSLLSWRRSAYCSAALLRRRNSCFLRPFCSSSRRFETVSAWDYGEEDDDDDGAALLCSRSNPWKRAPNLATEEEKKKKEEEVGSDSIDSVVDNSPWKDRNSSGHSYGRFISVRSQNSATTRTMADSSSDGNKGRDMVISEGEEKEVGFESIANNLQWKERNSSGHSHVRFISDRSQNSLTTRAMVDLPSNGNKGRDIVMPEGEEKKETGFVSISVDNSRRKGGNSSDHSYGRFISNRSQNSLGTRTMVESSTDTTEGRDMSVPMKNGLKLDEWNSRIFTLSQTQPSRLQNKFSPFNKKQPFLRSTEVVDSQRATSYNKNFNERGSSQSLLPCDNQSGDSHYFNEEGFPEATDKDQNKQQFSRFSKGGPKRGPPSVPLSKFDLFSSPPGSDPKSSFIRDWISDKPMSNISKGVARSSPRHLSRSFGTRSKSSRSSIPAKYSKYTRQTDIPAVNSSNSLGFTDVSQSRQVDSLLDSKVTSSLLHKGSLVFKEGGHDFSTVYAEEGEDVVNTTSISFLTHSFDSDSSKEGEEEGDSAEIENDYSMPRSFDSDSEEGEEERDSAEIENDYSMPRQASERDPSTVSSDALTSSQEVENGLESGWKSDHDMPSGGKAIKKPHPDWELPFEFQFSYSETPKVDPIGFREPQYSPFGPTTMPRPWTGRAPIKPSKKKLPVFDSFNPPPHGKKGVKYVQEPGPFPPGQIPREALSREDILGKPLTPVEIRDLVESYRKEKRQVNLGRDGLTHNMLDVIHKHWKRRRICKIKCKGVPTIDMDNVCFHIEEKTGGKIIFRNGGVVYLFRGRHYNYKNRPSIPLVLWKPKAPIYPKLIQKVPDGLTEAEASLLRKMGRKVKPICRLAKNGVYLNLVKDVREAFGVDELVRIDCRGLNPSDFKKIGAKLKDLVPCVLLSFEDEHVLMWRGKSSTSSLVLDESKSEESSMGCADGLEEEVGTKTCLDSTTSIPMEGPRVDGLEQIGTRMSLDSMSISVEGPREDGLEEMGKRTYLDSMSIPMESMAIPMESPRVDGLEEEMGARINIDSMSTLLEGPSVVGLEEISPSTHVDSMSIRLEDSRVDEERKEEELGDAMANLTRSELPDPILFTSSSLSLRSVSVGQSPDGSNLANNNTILHSLGDIRLQKLGERVDYLWDQALESGMALPLEDLQLDADAILSKANELAQEAPPGPVYNAHLERKAPEPRNIKRKKVPSTDRVDHSKSESFYTEELELRRLAKLLEP